MSFPGKFDAVDGWSSHLGGAISVGGVSSPSGAIIVPDAHLLFTGDFKRTGVDLIISKDDRELLVADYFKGEKRAALASPDGAQLSGDVVSALTGHVQVAQADGSASVSKVIGHVSKLTGTATATRNGVSIILNNGDNVEKGDVVQAGSNSTLGITFIDGTVFGLSANARMVLNEMIYEANGSNNSTLLSLVQGTISFVAGATAKQGGMKIDTPAATMGIRGTAVLVEIDFEVPGGGTTPVARFQVLVEPDGTTGSYILFDKITLTPLATVSQAGTQTSISGGVVSFLASAPLSPDAQRIISDVFALRFTDNLNPNPKTTTALTNTINPESGTPIRLSDGSYVIPTLLVLNLGTSPSFSSNNPTDSLQHIDLPPEVVTTNASDSERAGVTGSSSIDTLSGTIRFADINRGNLPTVQARFDSFSYHNARHDDVTATLTAQQRAVIETLDVPLVVVPDAGNNNNGSATWTYSVAASAFDFLAAGETVTLTYMAQVDTNYPPYNTVVLRPFTITITGTNDVPTIAATSAVFTELSGGGATVGHASGTITFADVDLTDNPAVSTAFRSFTYVNSDGNNVTSTLTSGQLAAIAAVEASLTLTPSAGNANQGSITWSYDVADNRFGFLSAGETLTLTYAASVDDGHGGVTTTLFTVTILGSGDPPHFITELPGQTGDTFDLAIVTGTVAFTGADLNVLESAINTVASATWSGGNQLPNGLLDTLESSLTTAVTSSVDFTFSATDNTFDFLGEGETLTIIYDVTVTDDGGLSSTRSVTIIVTGTNDIPTITAELTDAIGAVTEDVANPFLSDTGTIAFNDVDLIDV
ncbi:MAG: VCBS domain-containing protein, partial [Bradyrhizobium sp.]|uniref:VCBS domain-containing protein n=1 Tax=Bradyrhizobium sp. TaxID=376 RepID=UPI00272F6D13